MIGQELFIKVVILKISFEHKQKSKLSHRVIISIIN